MSRKHVCYILAGVMAVTFMAGCKHETTAIQKKYAADRVKCRSAAERVIGNRAPSSHEEHLKMVGVFADCMEQHGWQVSDSDG